MKMNAAVLAGVGQPFEIGGGEGIAAGQSEAGAEMVGGRGGQADFGFGEVLGGGSEQAAAGKEGRAETDRDAQCAGVDLLREDLVVTAGVQTPPVELVLRDDGAILSGKVAAAGQSRKPTLIVLLSERSSGGRVRTAFAGADGDFTVQNLAPGDYSVFAFDHSDDLEYANPDVLERYIASAVHVSLQPNEEHTTNLDVIHVGN